MPDSASRSRLYRDSAKFPKGNSSATERGAIPDFTAGKRRRPVYTLCIRIIIKKKNGNEWNERSSLLLLPCELDPRLWITVAVHFCRDIVRLRKVLKRATGAMYIHLYSCIQSGSRSQSHVRLYSGHEWKSEISLFSSRYFI